MIDTIVLALDCSNFQITDYSRFTPSAKLVFAPIKQNLRAVQNPKQFEGEYLPFLTLYRTITPIGFNITLYVSFSIPKLLFGNNFDEVTEEDFKKVLVKLSQRLAEMGVKVGEQQLAVAMVSRIDYGKNFVLTDYSSPLTYIDEIVRANISRVFDANQADYRNGGQSISFHTNPFELIFYDKIRDLAKAKVSPKKSIEKDKAPQLDFYHTVQLKQKNNPPMEVLRMEVRLNKRRRIRDELKKIDHPVEPTFKNLFSQRIARLICLRYLETIKDKIIFANADSSSPFAKKLNVLLANNPHLKRPDLVLYIGFQNLVQELGLRTARQMVFPKNNSAWYSFKRKADSIAQPTLSTNIDKLIAITKNFNPIRVLDI